MGITSCVIRSDNAGICFTLRNNSMFLSGCYRNGPLMRSLITMQQEIGMKIEGFLYSEAQAGKSACDRGLFVESRSLIACGFITYFRICQSEEKGERCRSCPSN